MSGLGGYAMGPGLCEQESRLARQGLGRKRGWELFCEGRAGAGFGLKIVTSQLLSSLSTLTFHDPKLLFRLPLK